MAVVSAIILGGALASPHYVGAAVPYALFHGACVLLALAAFLRPVSYGFTALSIFLLLGFWVKTIATLSGIPVLIEPGGQFVGSAEVFDRALLFTAAGLTGLALPRIAWSVSPSTDTVARGAAGVPVWYAGGRKLVWAITVVAVAGGAYANWRYRFYVVGVHELLVLPFPFNAALGWWYTAGSSLWIAALLEWERRLRGGRSFAPWLLIPLAEAAITSVVMLSRGFFLMKMLAYVLAVARPGLRRQMQLRPPTAAALLALTVTMFAVSLAGVSWLRMVTYPSMLARPTAAVAPAPGSDQPAPADASVAASPAAAVQVADEMKARTRELGRMILGRWIGLEGVLAVAAAPALSLGLLREGLAESPTLGNAALYQQLAGATYKPLPGFTFLTVPGVVAVLAYSGWWIVILLGMCLLSSLLIATERGIRRLFANDLLCAVAGVAMANALAQMNFPYLTFVFFVELVVTVGALWVISVIGIRSTPAPDVPAGLTSRHGRGASRARM